MCFRPPRVRIFKRVCLKCEEWNPPEATVCCECGAELPEPEWIHAPYSQEPTPEQKEGEEKKSEDNSYHPGSEKTSSDE